MTNTILFDAPAEANPEVPWPAFRHDEQGSVVNPLWCALLGSDPAEAAHDWLDDVVDDEREMVAVRWQLARAARAPWGILTRLRAVDRIVPVMLRLVPTTTGWYGGVVDLSEERAKASQAEERLRMAEAAAGIGTWRSDIVAGESRFSATLSKMLGLFAHDDDRTDEYVICGDTSHLFHPADLDTLQRNITAALDPAGPGSAVFEVRMLRVDGSVLWIRSSGRTIFDVDGRPLHMVGTSVDITAIRHAARRLATQNAVSTVLAEAMSLSEATPKIIRAVCESEGFDFGGIWEIDQQQQVLRCAEMWNDPGLPLLDVVMQTRLVSHARGEGLPGRVWALRQPVAVEDIAAADDLCSIAATKAGLRGALAFPITVGGEVIAVVEFVGRTAVRADDGLLEMFAAIGRQLGLFFERQRADVERRNLEAQLRQSQRIEAIGQLSGGIAHDFNNILAAIVGNVQLAMMDVDADHPVVESLEQIGQASNRAKALVQQILTFARQRPQQRQVIAPGIVVDESIRLLRALVPAGVDFVCHVDADVCDIDADATQLEQVIVNLGTNAHNALDGKAGQIGISLRNAVLDEHQARQHAGLRAGRWAVLGVDDTGRGMSPDILERIFEPFFTTRHGGKGTGLGLSVVHGIVKSHGGVIAVRSAPGTGTHFDIYFPDAGAPVPVDAVPAQTVRRGGGEHVLFVDDEAPLVALHKRLLQHLGYRVSAFTSSSVALSAFLADPWSYSLVLTDMNMPGLSGLQLATEMLRVRPDLPVVLASGFITDELQAELTRLGICEVLHKPVNAAQLGEALARCLKVAELA